MIKVAAIQMISGIRLDENLITAARLIQQAASDGAKLVALPENFALMGMHETDKLAISEKLGQGPIQNFLSEQAAKHQVILVGGTIPIMAENSKKARAACLVFNEMGERIGRYDKIHLFDVMVDDEESYIESDSVEPGDEVITVDTSIGKLGLSVCYDLRFPELYRQLSSKGADILLVPSAFTAITGRAHWEVLLRARAIENLCYVIAPNQGGKHQNGRETFGHSMIIEPWGEVLTSCNTGNGIAVANIEMDKSQKIQEKFPVHAHRKLN